MNIILTGYQTVVFDLALLEFYTEFMKLIDIYNIKRIVYIEKRHK